MARDYKIKRGGGGGRKGGDGSRKDKAGKDQSEADGIEGYDFLLTVDGTRLYFFNGDPQQPDLQRTKKYGRRIRTADRDSKIPNAEQMMPRLEKCLSKFPLRNFIQFVLMPCMFNKNCWK